MHRLSEGRVGHDAGMEFPRPFTTDEYDRRVVAVQAEMARRSMAGLVVVDPASMYYLCGYDAWSFYMPQCVVVPSSGDLHLFTRAMDASGGGADIANNGGDGEEESAKDDGGLLGAFVGATGNKSVLRVVK